MDLPADSALFGRPVVDVGGRRLGRIEAVVHRRGEERVAVVRRGVLQRRWYRVPLAGARLDGGAVQLA